jgi:hypothetical protein
VYVVILEETAYAEKLFPIYVAYFFRIFVASPVCICTSLLFYFRQSSYVVWPLNVAEKAENNVESEGCGI